MITIKSGGAHMSSLSLSILDAINFAIELEERGTHFYREAAKRMEDEDQRNLVLLLMGQTNEHLEDVKKIFSYVELQRGIDATPLDSETASYIAALGKNIGFPSEAQAAQKIADCISVSQILNIAIQGEKDSLSLYKEISEKAVDTEVKKIFNALKSEEQSHVEQLGEMLAGWA